MKLLPTLGLALLTPLVAAVAAANFDFELVQLTEEDIGSSAALAFGDATASTRCKKKAQCKAEPGSKDWPSDEEWAALDAALGGRLLKPTNAGAVCFAGDSDLYDEEACELLLGPDRAGRFYPDDPVSVYTGWAQGMTCMPSLEDMGNCTQGGAPTYVVNATTVKDVQAAVNFARNKNVRFNIKNTGHDFMGKSTAGFSLSVWTHYLNDQEYLSDFSIGEYEGPALLVGAGLEGFAVHNAMNESGEYTVITGACPTVGLGGGWGIGGGHSTLSSYYGLGADQILSLNVVTADGKFVTADMEQNTDLYWALRGGGPSTYGVVTSQIVKAHPQTFISGVTFSFTVGPTKVNATTNAPFPFNPSTEVDELETFWDAYSKYLFFTETAIDSGGFCLGDIRNIDNNGSFTFASGILMPDMAPEEMVEFIEPMFESFREAGVNITSPEVMSQWYALPDAGNNGGPGDSFFASRLFPRANWHDEERFAASVAAIRSTVEDGSLWFRGRSFGASVEVAGYPTNKESSSIHEAFRNSLMHATIFSLGDYSDLPADEAWWARYDALTEYMEGIRAATPDSGAYLNEAELLEPNWQESFYGENYERLLEIKKEMDPWDVFWAPTTVGSEGWEVLSTDGIPSQNGPLCRVK